MLATNWSQITQDDLCAAIAALKSDSILYTKDAPIRRQLISNGNRAGLGAMDVVDQRGYHNSLFELIKDVAAQNLYFKLPDGKLITPANAVPTVPGELKVHLEEKIATLVIPHFDESRTEEWKNFEKHLSEIKGKKTLYLDIRNNVGTGKAFFSFVNNLFGSWYLSQYNKLSKGIKRNQVVSQANLINLKSLITLNPEYGAHMEALYEKVKVECDSNQPKQTVTVENPRYCCSTQNSLECPFEYIYLLVSKENGANAYWLYDTLKQSANVTVEGERPRRITYGGRLTTILPSGIELHMPTQELVYGEGT